MDLPEIDVVALQPPQRSIKIAKQRAPRRVDNPLAVSNHESGFGGDYHLVAVSELTDQSAHNALSIARAVCGGGVDQGAAGVAKHLEQGMSVLCRCVAAPGHGAKPEPRDT